MSLDKVDRFRAGVAVLAGAGLIGLVGIMAWQSSDPTSSAPTHFNGDSVGRNNGESIEAYIARCRNTRIDAADSFALVTFTQPLGAREAAEIVGFAGSGGAGVGRVSAVVPYENAPVALPEPVAGATREDVFRRWAGDAPIAGLIVYTNGSAKEKIRSDQRDMCVESLPADAAWGKFGIKPVL